jgi:hypothetical protein
MCAFGVVLMGKFVMGYAGGPFLGFFAPCQWFFSMRRYVTMATRKRRNEERNRGEHKGRDDNRDPITGAPGAHPVGTGIGAAAGGAAAGAAAGTVAGPIGTAAGMVAGAVIGGLAGKGIAEKIDPTVESAYWRENYNSRPYVDRDAQWDDYEPAYRTGYEGYGRYRGRRFDEVETDLRGDYERGRGRSSLAWDKARFAARDAWDRVERRIPGDADGDGR